MGISSLGLFIGRRSIIGHLSTGPFVFFIVTGLLLAGSALAPSCSWTTVWASVALVCSLAGWALALLFSSLSLACTLAGSALAPSCSWTTAWAAAAALACLLAGSVLALL